MFVYICLQLQCVLAILQRIEPGLKEVKITRKEAPTAYPHLTKVLKNHTRSSDYMAQFLKHPISGDSNMCDCKACELELFKPLRMPLEAFTKLRANLFPLPIPNLTPDSPGGDLSYMSLTESMLLPFTDEHQPSKMTRVVATAAKDLLSPSAMGPMRGIGRARVRRGRRGSNRGASDDADLFHRLPQAPTTQKIMQRKNFPLGHLTRIRGIVQCMECKKPRCIYSLYAITHMQPPGESSRAEQDDCR